ncbi:MAG: tetratricopeptide repeat protein, partial [Halodesulfovibrio sp.]
TAPVSPAKPAPVMADNEQSAPVLADDEQPAPVLAEGEQPAPENAEATNAEAAVAPEQKAPYTPFNADGRQAELIIARSTFMQGDHESARAMYRVLLAKYGPDEEITSGYVETLLEGKRWAEAEAELAAWRARSPHSLDALRQTARLYLLLAEENGNYEAAYPWLEALLEQTPEDTDIKSDYAYARLNAGDWNGALALFSDVLDADPENADAAEAVRTICRDRSPQLRADFRSEVQTGEVSINTLETEYSQQLNPAWRLAVSEERSSIHRKGNNQGTTRIATEILRHSVRARNDIDTRWSLLSGISYFSGKTEGMGAEAGLERRDLLGGTLSLEGVLNAPWLSTLDAVDREGTTDTYTARYERPLNDYWSMSASVGATRYSLENLSGYSWQEREEFALTRSIRYLPDLTASYIFTRTRQHYRQDDPADRPVDLVDKEDIHALRLEMLHWYNDYVALRAFGSAGYDVFRPSPLFGAGGGLRFRLGERVDLDAGFEYNNDTGQAGGGEAKALTSSIIFRF